MTADPALAEQAAAGPGEGGQADPDGPEPRQEPRQRRRLAVPADQPRQRHQRLRLAGHGAPRREVGRAARSRRRTSTAPSPTSSGARSKGGGFAYQPGQGPNNPRTGTGILALEICGEHLTPEAVAGAEYLVKHPPQLGRARTSSTRSITARRPCSRWATSTSSPITPSSSRSSSTTRSSDGSWLSGDGNDRSGGRIYCTAMAVLALAVEYRYLPIYQR